MRKNVVKALVDTIQVLRDSLDQEVATQFKKVVSNKELENLIESDAEDISSRYWLQQCLEPLNQKELRSIISGFLIPMINDAQAKKLVRFLMLRYPELYSEKFLAGLSLPSSGEVAEAKKAVGSTVAFQTKEVTLPKRLNIKSKNVRAKVGNKTVQGDLDSSGFFFVYAEEPLDRKAVQGAEKLSIQVPYGGTGEKNYSVTCLWDDWGGSKYGQVVAFE